MRLGTAIIAASVVLTVAVVGQASGIDKAGADRPRTSIYTNSSLAEKLHMRAKRALGDDFACVSFRNSPGRGVKNSNLDLRITSRVALRKARRIAAGIPSRDRVTVSVVDPKFGFEAMQLILRNLSSGSPGGNIFIHRDPGYRFGPTPNGVCKPVVIETNGVLTAPTPDQLVVPPDWYETPEYKWAAEQSRLYGEDRVQAYPQRFPRQA